MRLLGIETSCDETGIAIYDSDLGILAEGLYSQIETHAAFGGVVPELASRDHLKKISPLFEETLNNSGLTIQDLDGVAYTKGPGLVGALMIGAVWAKSLALSIDKPSLGIHHLEGHLFAPFLEPDTSLSFPFLALLVSGGHTELIQVDGLGLYKTLGDTVDDAAGEAFDKTAKLLGLGYPGGAKLSELANQGKPNRFRFPRPMVNRKGLDFSFSGLKTFALNTITANAQDQQTQADIAHAFQSAIVDTLTIKTKRALQQTGVKTLIVAGGVGANQPLRRSLMALGNQLGIKVYFPKPTYCTDNGAMIAYVGYLRMQAGEREALPVEVLPRWKLDNLQPPLQSGSDIISK